MSRSGWESRLYPAQGALPALAQAVADAAGVALVRGIQVVLVPVEGTAVTRLSTEAPRCSVRLESFSLPAWPGDRVIHLVIRVVVEIDVVVVAFFQGQAGRQLLEPGRLKVRGARPAQQEQRSGGGKGAWHGMGLLLHHGTIITSPRMRVMFCSRFLPLRM